MSDGPHDASTPGQITRLLRAAADVDTATAGDMTQRGRQSREALPIYRRTDDPPAARIAEAEALLPQP